MINRKNFEHNLKSLNRKLAAVKSHIASRMENDRISSGARRLRERAAGGEPAADLLPEAYALVFEAIQTSLGLTPHDVQILAAIAMAQEQIIELPTGEGKTLAAVFTASLMALSGRGVHVLTANDYLAQRDALWMMPVYNLLGLSVGYIGETSDPAARRRAYDADITYVTAKEAGFDCLRGFLAYDAASVTQRPFHFAVIDEADFILIDEARNPLVISGDAQFSPELDESICRAVAKMQKDIHYKTDEYGSEIYLDEAGIDLLEKELSVGDIYEDRNLPILEKAEAVLQARFLLKRDTDYIVRDGQVLMIDKFTGRIAQSRQWTETLQSAVEIKEGLRQTAKGKIMNSITLQNFLSLYPGFCGMTGTARSAAAEFQRFYNTSVTVIPPDRPCIRTDFPDLIFADKRAKLAALTAEIRKIHATGQPILIGTSGIEESELLADRLRGDIETLVVLNARQDAEEAAVIANAGMPGAVTISTNMAGRGVDIRLGGADEAYYGEVRALGGLYVIGTNRHESVRIDDQLRGRAGRQGDPGMSRFFISLEDDLLIRYGLSAAIPERYRNALQDEPFRNKEVERAVGRTQSIVEAQTFDAKITLFKYSRVVELQRRLVHEKRNAVLLGQTALSVLQKERPDQYRELSAQVPEDEFIRAQRQIELYAINLCWSDHLLYIDSVMDEVRMQSAVKENPLTYYNRRLAAGFEELQKHIRDEILDIYDKIIIHDRRIDLDAMNIKGPTSSKTYLVHDGSELQNAFSGASAIAAVAFTAPLFFFYALAEKLKRHKNNADPASPAE